MLALAEAYGVVDEQMLWEGVESIRSESTQIARSIATMAVQCALTSQENNLGKRGDMALNREDADTR